MNYHNITCPDMNNGDGLRVVLWLSGCNHRCKGCQNPQTWDKHSGILFDEAAEEELFKDLSQPWVSGLTLSGGDPLHPDNRNEVLKLMQKVKKTFPQKTIWLYTGYTWESLNLSKRSSPYAKQLLSILFYCDVLVDGPFIEDLADVSYPWAGSTNQRVIDVHKTLGKCEIVLWKS